MAVFAVVHTDGRTARMTDKRFAAVASDGWSIVDPGDVVDEPASKPVKEVLDEVGNDPVKAAAALELEQAGKNRSTLTRKLQGIVDAGGNTQED